MRKAGFIFSLDAFVAFTLTMVTVGMLIFIIGTPKPFYPSLEQAHELAHDTLSVLATSSDRPADPLQPTYLEQIMKNPGTAKAIMFKVAGGSDTYPGRIPKGFGYRLETYDFNSGSWNEPPIYDSGLDCQSSLAYAPFTYFSDRCGKNFTKLSASATTFASIYTDPPVPGESPYCYLSCFGYENQYANSTHCDTVPCNVSIWNFQTGNNSIQLIRLVVYT